MRTDTRASSGIRIRTAGIVSVWVVHIMLACTPEDPCFIRVLVCRCEGIFTIRCAAVRKFHFLGSDRNYHF